MRMQRDLVLGVHNHGPGHVVPDLAAVETVLEGTGDHFGACVDTAHFMRAEEDPVEAVYSLGDAVTSVHLGDIDENGTEVLPGDGQLDLASFLDALDDATALEQPIIIEYEANPADPTPAIVETAERIGLALAEE
jgi:sugar phosphate isomerase/epimerase